MTALSFHNPRVQRLRRLSGRRSPRHDEGAFVIEGAVLVREAIEAGLEIEAVFAAEGVSAPDLGGRPVLALAPGVIERIASTVSPQPVLAVAHIPVWSADTVAGAGFVVVLVDLNDPGNVGTLVRTAEAAGADVVVLAGGCADAWSPKTVRAAAGSLFRTPVVTAPDVAGALGRLRAVGFRRIGTSSHAMTSLWDADLTGRIALVLGSEAHGLDERLALDEWVAIPMQRGESLNVAAAGAVLCFEARRQRVRRGTSTGEG